MKFLKYLIIVVAVFSASFICVGFINPTITYETTVLVNKPVSHSFAVFNNPFNRKKWMPGFKSITTMSGLPNQVGSTYELIFEEGGEEIILTEEVTEFERNKLFAFNMSNEVFNSKIKITFEEEDGKTRITSTSVVTGSNMMFRSMFPFMKSVMEEKDKEMFTSLRDFIESDDYHNNVIIDYFLNRG